MRVFRFAALSLFVCAAAGGYTDTVQAQQRTSSQRLGSQVTWSFEKNKQPVQYRFGEVTLTVKPYHETAGDESVAPEVTVSAPGRAPVTMRGAQVWPNAEHHIGVGRLDRAGNLFVELQSFTGGAHCCNQITVAMIEPQHIRLVELGMWDGSPGDMPRDVNGDGNVDWVQLDNSFLYSFASYAESAAPPQIVNIVDGRPEDVSEDPSYFPIFQRAVNDLRRGCLTRRRSDSNNSACAAYVASAARIGQFDAAWARVSRAYNDKQQWDYPTGCRFTPDRENGCPDSHVIDYGGFLPSLRAFLVDREYILP